VKNRQFLSFILFLVVTFLTVYFFHTIVEEKNRGVLARGMLADFVMLSDDIVQIGNRSIQSVKVLMTVVGGEPVYRTSRK